MQWWCSARGVAWEWAWQPYIGVWLLVLSLAAAYAIYLRRIGPPTDAEQRPEAPRSRKRRIALFATGLFCIWLGLDWPLGPLGAGYLASVHMVVFILVALVAPPLLLLGLPPVWFEGLRRHPRIMAWLRNVTRPLVAFFIFNILMSVTHWPAVVDFFMTSQIGAFALDMSWLAAGLILWWPVVAPVPEWPGFRYLYKMGYLAINGIIVRPPFAILFFSDYPVYAIYELAPPISGITTLGDQYLAAGIMKLGTAWTMFVGIAILFYAWFRSEQDGASPAGAPGSTRYGS